MAHILLVDDDMDLVQVNSLVLERRGHQVTVAYSAVEALETLEQCEPDILLVDVMMETKSAGFELARAVHQRYPQMPMVMLTGVRDAMGVNFKFEPDETWLPVTVFLEKPIDPVTLANKVEEVLRKRQCAD